MGAACSERGRCIGKDARRDGEYAERRAVAVSRLFLAERGVSVGPVVGVSVGGEGSRSSRIGVTTPFDPEDLNDARSYFLPLCWRRLLSAL